MFAKLKAHAPLAVACLALFFGVGGPAFGADVVGNATRLITGKQIKNGSVTTKDIKNGSLLSADFKPGQLRAGPRGPKGDPGPSTGPAGGDLTGNYPNPTIADGAVTHGKLGLDSIDGSNVAQNSLALSDILGASLSGTIGFTLGPNACGNLNISVSGAQPGQVVLFSFTGATAVPGSIVFGGTKVTAADTVVVRACNVGAASVTVSNLGIRVATFG